MNRWEYFHDCLMTPENALKKRSPYPFTDKGLKRLQAIWLMDKVQSIS